MFLWSVYYQPELPACGKSANKNVRLHSIGPYRYQMLLMLAEHLKEIQSDRPWNCSPECEIVIGKSGGKPLSVKLNKSTGRAKADTNLQNMLRAIKFDSLPKWYHGMKMTFRVPLYAAPPEPENHH
jgi:hypothetical protein